MAGMEHGAGRGMSFRQRWGINWSVHFLPIFILFSIVLVPFLVLRIVGRGMRDAESASHDAEAAFLGPEEDTEFLQEKPTSEEPKSNDLSPYLPQKSVQKSDSEGPMDDDPKPSLLD